MTTTRVDVVGAGIIGLSIAWRAAQAGLSVTVHDPDLGAGTTGASYAAAGMLAPVTEAHYGEEALLALNLASHERWPAFATELAEASDRPVPFRAEGSLLVAFDDDDLRVLDELQRFHDELGLPGAAAQPRVPRSRADAVAPHPRRHPRRQRSQRRQPRGPRRAGGRVHDRRGALPARRAPRPPSCSTATTTRPSSSLLARGRARSRVSPARLCRPCGR